jgi:hypothetical protein
VAAIDSSPCTPIMRTTRCSDLCATAHTTSPLRFGTANVYLRDLYEFQTDAAVSVGWHIVWDSWFCEVPVSEG